MTGFKKWPFALSIILLALVLTLTISHATIAQGATKSQLQPNVTPTTIHTQTIAVFTNQVITPNHTIQSSFIKVRDFSKAVLYVSFSSPLPHNLYEGQTRLVLEGLFSIDRINDYPNTVYNADNSGLTRDGISSQELMPSRNYTSLIQNVTGPYYRVTMIYGYDPNMSDPAVTVNASLYLIP